MVMHTWIYINISNCSSIPCYHKNFREIVQKPILFQQKYHLKSILLNKEKPKKQSIWLIQMSILIRYLVTYYVFCCCGCQSWHY